MGLTRLAIHRPLTILMGILGLVLLGGVAYTRLNVDRLPPVTIGVVSVSASLPNASAENVEQLVTEPLENAVAGISGVDTVTSTSSEGSASVIIQLTDGYDPNQADLDIQQAMGPVIRQLPANATAPVVRKFDPNASPVLNIALTGAALDQLYDIANNQMQPDLESVPGVGQVNLSGGLQREIEVQVNYDKLAGYGVTLQQLATALTSANVAIPSGSVPTGTEIINVVPQGLFMSVQDIQNVFISDAPTGGAITVGDVATVVQTDKTQSTLQRLNGQDAVGLSITPNSDANTVQVADAVEAELAHLEPLLPAGTRTTIVNDQSVFTRASLEAIQRDLALAVILVAVVMLVFLHDWKHTIIVLSSIPTSLISTFLVMYVLGFTLNTISLLALALMIGILVDDSIVVLENIQRHLQLGESPWQAALTGRSEIALPAIAITLADVVVYAPIAFTSGSIGQLFREYGLTVVAATLFSLLISFTLTPMLASRWLRQSNGLSHFTRLAALGRQWDRGFAKLASSFANSVPITVRHRWLVLGIATCLVAAAGATIPLHLIGTEYAPAEDDNNFTVNLQLPAGTSLDATNEAAQQLEGMVRALPEVQYYFTSVSIPGGSGFNRGGASSVNMTVQTVPKNERRRSVFDLINVLRGQARTIAGASFSGGVASPLPGGGGGGAGSINLSIGGPDLNTVTALASQAQAALQSVPGVTDIRNTNLNTVPELDVTLNRAQMAQLGITNQQVDDALASAIGGSTVTEFQPPGTQQEDITLLGDPAQRDDLTTLDQIPVGVQSAPASSGSASTASAPTGAVVTLGQIATLQSASGPVTIQRVNREVTTSLTATPNGRPLGEIAGDIQTAMKTIPFPAGYGFTLLGQVQILNQALAALGTALILSVILEYMLLVALYESWLFPLVRMLTVPLGVIGALVLLLLTGNTINIFSIIGLIMGEGLVAKSGILLVDYTNVQREHGMGRTEALQEAVRVRLRPILMTSSTLIFGLLPLALKLEPGAEVRAPVAIVVIGALLSSTLLTLVVVPALYTVVDDVQTALLHRGQSAAQAFGVAGAVAATGRLNENDVPPSSPGAAAGSADGSRPTSDTPVHLPRPLIVTDRGRAYVVQATLPGNEADDVWVSATGRTLTIRGRKPADRMSTPNNGIAPAQPPATWERTLSLPDDVNGSALTATYHDNLLEVQLPKAIPESDSLEPARNGSGAPLMDKRPSLWCTDNTPPNHVDVAQ